MSLTQGGGTDTPGAMKTAAMSLIGYCPIPEKFPHFPPVMSDNLYPFLYRLATRAL